MSKFSKNQFAINQFDESGKCFRVDYSSNIRGARWIATRQHRQNANSCIAVIRSLYNGKVYSVYAETGLEDCLGKEENTKLLLNPKRRASMGKVCRAAGLSEEDIKTRCHAFAD